MIDFIMKSTDRTVSRNEERILKNENPVGTVGMDSATDMPNGSGVVQAAFERRRTCPAVCQERR